MRGGGVGFYVKNGIQTEIIEELSPFENKIIEALTIKITLVFIVRMVSFLM